METEVKAPRRFRFIFWIGIVLLAGAAILFLRIIAVGGFAVFAMPFVGILALPGALLLAGGVRWGKSPDKKMNGRIVWPIIIVIFLALTMFVGRIVYLEYHPDYTKSPIYQDSMKYYNDYRQQHQ